ncbi:MAG: hypothetical protein ACI9OD_001975 [Limisphaerales bacterium]|jgi:hypothetical protein
MATMNPSKKREVRMGNIDPRSIGPIQVSVEIWVPTNLTKSTSSSAHRPEENDGREMIRPLRSDVGISIRQAKRLNRIQIPRNFAAQTRRFGSVGGAQSRIAGD